MFVSVSEVPAELDRRLLALCGPPGTPKWAVFECPCGRGHRIVLNLHPERRPAWRFFEHGGRPSLHPSVDYRGEHRCHFWLSEGRVHWARERVALRG